MTNSHDDRLRRALSSLGGEGSGRVDDIPLPPLFRAPVIALMWIALAVTTVCLLALARVRVPRVARGVAIAVESGADSVSLMLLLPTDAQPYLRVGQRATVDVGSGRPVVLGLTTVDSSRVDVRSARLRFPQSPQVLAHFEAPKVVAVLSRCSADHACLTPEPGAVYQATASLGTRTLASLAWSSTPVLAR